MRSQNELFLKDSVESKFRLQRSLLLLKCFSWEKDSKMSQNVLRYQSLQSKFIMNSNISHKDHSKFYSHKFNTSSLNNYCLIYVYFYFS